MTKKLNKGFKIVHNNKRILRLLCEKDLLLHAITRSLSPW